jgi:hypothetical protein
MTAWHVPNPVIYRKCRVSERCFPFKQAFRRLMEGGTRGTTCPVRSRPPACKDAGLGPLQGLHPSARKSQCEAGDLVAREQETCSSAGA